MLYAVSTLGIKEILVALTYLGRMQWSMKYLTATLKPIPTISQLLLKNKEVKPSGPRALLFEIENKDVWISSSKISSFKPRTTSSKIVVGKNLDVSSANWAEGAARRS